MQLFHCSDGVCLYLISFWPTHILLKLAGPDCKVPGANMGPTWGPHEPCYQGDYCLKRTSCWPRWKPWTKWNTQWKPDLRSKIYLQSIRTAPRLIGVLWFTVQWWCQCCNGFWHSEWTYKNALMFAIISARKVVNIQHWCRLSHQS